MQLSNLVQVKETVAPKELNHFNRLRAAIISANVAPGYTLGEALGLPGPAPAKCCRPRQTALDGQSREFRESGAQLYLIFVLALAFIYLVLSAQFESFVEPFVIMLTVPLAMTGALAALMLLASLRRHAERLQPDRAGDAGRADHQERHPDRGVRQPAAGARHGTVEAVIEAAALRLRPILMTTAAMVLGAVPLAAAGAGAESASRSAG